MGDSHAKLGNYTRSLEYLEQAIAIFRATLGPDSLEVAKCLNNLGENHARAGDPDSGIPLHQEALQIREQHAESDLDPSIGYGHWFLGDTLLRAKQYENAVVHLQAALDIWTGISGWNHPDIGWYAFRLAEALEGAGTVGEAELFYRKAVQSDEAAWGANHPNLAETLEGYAAFLQRTGREEEADALVTRASGIRDASEKK